MLYQYMNTMNKQDKLHMNDYYNEPEIILIEDIDNLTEEQIKEYAHETKSEHLLNQEKETLSLIHI